jgi:hypothetical protein
MNLAVHTGTNSTTRREFLKTSSKVVAGAALTAAIARPGYAAEANTIQVALVGCGGRGTGAAANALATTSGPIKLVAMADVFAERLNRSHDALTSAATKVSGSADSWAWVSSPARLMWRRSVCSSASTLTKRRWTA